MNIELDITEIRTILGVLEMMDNMSNEAISSALRKQDWDKWSKFTKHQASCNALYNKIKRQVID